MLPSICSKVSLRQRPLKDGRVSLYLDYYPAIRNPVTMKMSRCEYLGFYIYADPADEVQREYNDEILMRAELIRCRRQEAVINRQFGFLDRRQSEADFIEYFISRAREHNPKWDDACLYFRNFTGGTCRFGDLSVELCERFRSYLLHANQLRHPHLKLSRNSAAGYFSAFRSLLREAYRERLLKENLNDYLTHIKHEEVRKDYLSADEVKMLAATPCRIPVLKNASLFAILTGLRISDIIRLRWEDIHQGANGGTVMSIRIQKTRRESVHPLSQEMLSLCGQRGKGVVFKGFTRSMAQQPLKRWIKEAGITKHITFHRFRDTFATLQLAAGTDIYTVSKMLDHTSLATTQIYARLLDSTKRATLDRIKLR